MPKSFKKRTSFQYVKVTQENEENIFVLYFHSFHQENGITPKCHGEKSINVEHVTCLYSLGSQGKAKMIFPSYFFYIYLEEIIKVKRKRWKTKPANNRSLWGLGIMIFDFIFLVFFSFPFPFNNFIDELEMLGHTKLNKNRKSLCGSSN